MSGVLDTQYHATAVPQGVGGAVGVSDAKWFVAIVNNNTEKSVQEKLSNLGYEAYVASQVVLRIWKNGKKAKVDKVLMPTLVFVKCTEVERRKEIVTLPYINRFMTNRAGSAPRDGVHRPLAVIPQTQIDTLRFMLGQSDVPVSFTTNRYRPHDRIKVVRGKLQGIEGEVIKSEDGKSELIIRVDILGCATLVINTVDIELLG